MRVSYDKDQRKQAKDTGKRLYTFQITGPKGEGGITAQGIFGPGTRKEIEGYIDSVFKVLT